METERPILIVDDEPAICWCFEQLLGEEGFSVITTSTAEDGLQLAAAQQPALVVLDVRLPGMDGLTALPKFAAASPHSSIIIMTAFGDLQTAVRAVQQGAADYLTKPFGVDRARAVCRAALRQRELAGTAIPSGSARPPATSRVNNQLVGSSAVMQEVYRKIATVAESDLSVL